MTGPCRENHKWIHLPSPMESLDQLETQVSDQLMRIRLVSVSLA
jgi:hypothetical protein